MVDEIRALRYWNRMYGKSPTIHVRTDSVAMCTIQDNTNLSSNSI